MIRLAITLLLILTVTAQPLRLYSASTDPDSPFSDTFVGSIRGGTKIYINGAGFDPIATGNLVYVGDYPCEIPAQGVTTNFLTCETTNSMSDSNLRNLQIKVMALDQISVLQYPYFSYLTSATPYLYDVIPSSAIASTNLNFYGVHRVTQQGDGARDMGDFESLLIGEELCGMFDILQDTISQNSQSRVQCVQANLQEAGKYSITEKVAVGTADNYYYMKKASLSDEDYEHTVLPGVQSVSPNSGLSGGQDITITGTGFSNHEDRVSVTVDDVPCTVTSSTINEISCHLAEKVSQSSLLDTNSGSQTMGYLCGSGLSYERYDISTLSTKTYAGLKAAIDSGSHSMTLLESGVRAEIETPNIYETDGYGQVYKGYFYAPVAGNYIFRGGADDNFAIYLSDQYGSASVNPTPIIYADSASAYNYDDNLYIYNQSTALGQEIALEAGKYYYMEVYHINSVGNGYLKVSVEVPNSDATLSWQRHEVNQIQTSFTNDPQVREFVQEGATGGTFTLFFRRYSDQLELIYEHEATLNYNATASEFNSAIRGFDTYSYTISTTLAVYDENGTTTTGDVGSRFVWTVTIDELRDESHLEETILADFTNTIGSATFSDTQTHPHGPLISGTFTVDIGGNSLAVWDSSTSSYSQTNIPFDIQGWQLRNGLNQLFGEDKFDVFRLNDVQYGAKWIINYWGYNMDVPDWVISSAGLQGGLDGTSPSATFFETRPYSSNIIFNPIDERFMFSACSGPNVLVTVNDILGACTNDCAYSFQTTVPEIDTQSLAGSVLTLGITDPLSVGYSLNDVVVEVDGQACDNPTGTLTNFNCQLPTNTDGTPMLSAGTYHASVSISGSGVVEPTSSLTALTVPLDLTSLSPSSGGTNGGYLIQIEGTGFPLDSSQATITLCGRQLQVYTNSNTMVSVLVPECTAGIQTLTYEYNGLTQTISFTYGLPAVSAQITSISPTSASPVLKSVMTITGSGFGTNSSAVEVHLENSTGKMYEMRILTISDTTIQCGIPGGLPGDFQVKVNIDGSGDAIANPETADDFVYELVIESISPTSGSYQGGTLVTITGRNFSPTMTQNLVFVGNELNWMCSIQSLSTTEIQCRTPGYHADWGTTNTQGIVLTNRLIVDSTCEGSCDFTYNDEASSPTISSLSTTEIRSANGDITISGSNLNSGSSIEVVFQNRLTNQVTMGVVGISSDTSVTVAVPSVQAGFYNVRVRNDPVGQSNSQILQIKSNLSPSTYSGSVKGGRIDITGNGLPSSWPSPLFSISMQSNSIPYDVEVISTSPTLMCLNVPEGVDGQVYDIVILTPREQEKTLTFTQTTADTPQVSLLTSVPAAAGMISVSLNRTTHSSQNPASIEYYNTMNPDNVMSISSWTENVEALEFSQTFAAGCYMFKIYYDGYGYGQITETLDVSAPSAYTAAAVTSSYLGGVLTVTGDSISQDAMIKVGGFYGNAIQVSASSATFQIPQLLTSQVISNYPELQSTQKVQPFSIFSDGGSNENYAFDSTYATAYQSTNTECYIGMDIGEGKRVAINRIRYFPYNQWTIASNYIKGAIIEASADGSVYDQLMTVDQTVHAGWNSFLHTSSNTYRYIRLRHSTDSNCKLAQLQVFGTIYNDVTVSDINSHTFSTVTFSDGFNQYTFNNVVEYRLDKTPVVDSISPTTGDVFGGYDITLSGSYLDIGTPSIMIDGVECVVQSTSSSSIVCTVGARSDLPEENSFMVSVGDNKALVKEQFMYVLRWSDIRTWGTDLYPVQGDLVYVPQGMTLFVDQSTPQLEGIVVDDGKLIFADQSDMEIHAGIITINRGEFRAGTEENPYQHMLTFVMYGDYYGTQQPIFGNKGIGCLECKFSMHGKVRTYTWTMLSASIMAGDTTLNVMDSVDWEVGEEIVVASTDFDHNEAEKKTITAISGTTITVDSAFVHEHFSGVENYGSDSIQMRAQVGLLSRNIKMMGDETSVEDEYGSHLMMAGSAENGMVSHIAYTEFTHCGQPKIVGRYCIHFHMNGDVSDSLVKGNAVHESFARVITIHAIQFLHVSYNVGYRVKGHNFFIEDGIETQNVIEYNLAISSLESWNMMQTDISVASFWVTNPTNHLRYNHAAGGDFYGFWYQIKTHPDGPSATSDVCPIGNPLGESHDNVAHSYVRFGLRIFKLYSRQKPCQEIRDDSLEDPWSANPSIQSRFYNYVIYKIGEAGLLAEETGNALFEGFTIAESKRAGMEFYRCNKTMQFVEAKDIAIIGVTNGNAPADIDAAFGDARGVIGPRTGGWKMSNIRFHNLPDCMTVLQTCSMCENTLLFTNTGGQYFVEDISYNNVTAEYFSMAGLQRQIIYDLDGTFSQNFDGTSRSSATIVHNFHHLGQESACSTPTDATKWGDSLACDDTIKIRKVMFTNVQQLNLFKMTPMKVKLLSDLDEVVNASETEYTQFSSDFNAMQPMEDSKNTWSMPFAVGRVYNAWWLTGIDFSHIAIDVSQLYEDTDPAILFKFNYTQTRELFEIALWNRDDMAYEYRNYSNDLDAANCEFGQYIHDTNNSMIGVCVTSKGKLQNFQYLEVNGIMCRYLCANDDEEFEKEDFIRLWSNESQWPQGRLPTAGQNVTVEGPWNLIMDIIPQAIGYLQIDGELFISETLNEPRIICDNMWIRAGSLQAGSSSEPFPGNFTIEIRGNRDDVGIVIDENIAGNKMIVVTGELLLYGNAPSTTWTRLAQFVYAGQTQMDVDSANGWAVGDQIVVGPSFNNAQEHEKVTITAISGNTVTFTPALQYNHYGDPSVTISNSIGTLDTRSAVGHLSRSIKIVSGDDSGWGYRLLGYAFNEASIIRKGQIVLSGVQLYEGGQYDTEKTSLQMINMIGSNMNTITKSSIHQCKSYCMDIADSRNIQVTQNVFYNGRVFHARVLGATNYQFTNNLMIAATSRPTFSGEQLIACYGSWDQISTSDEVIVSNNLCQGSDLHGFALAYIPCDDLASNPFSQNTVGSAQTGFIFNKITGSCMSQSGIRAYACRIGQIASSPGTQQLVFEDFMIADSMRAATLRFGKEGDDRSAFFRNSFITAISRPSCTDCYGTGATDCTGNHAVRMLAVTVNGEMMPEKFGNGFDVICKQETYDSKAYLQNVIFENFNQEYGELPQCSNNVVFRPHSTASDMTGSHNLFNVTCNNCSLNAYAYFDAPNTKNLGWGGGCGKILCTGKNNYLIHDYNGTFLPEPGVLLANNSVIGDNTPDCTYISEINGHYCNREDFHVIQYESIAPDFNTRIMWPVYLSYDGGQYQTQTNGWRQWDWQGNQPLNKRLGRFVSVVELSKIYNMTFSSQPPIDMRLQFQRRTVLGDNSEFIIVKLHYPRPNSIRVQNGGQTIKPITLLDNDGEDPLDNTTCGSNKFFYENYTVHFVLTGDKNCQVRVSLTNSIQLTARFNMDIDDFYNQNGQTQFIDRMCALLGVDDTSRLKVVGIYNGSVTIVATIDEPTYTDTSNSTENNNVAIAAEMEELNRLLVSLYEDGTVGENFTDFGEIISLTSAVYDHLDSESETTPVSQDNMVALIVGLSLGCAMLAGLISFGIYMKCRKSSKVQVETMDTTMSEEQKIGSVKGSSEHNRTLGINDKINERNVSSEFNTSKIET